MARNTRIINYAKRRKIARKILDTVLWIAVLALLPTLPTSQAIPVVIVWLCYVLKGDLI